MRAVMIIALAVAMAIPAVAAPKTKVIGNWVLMIDDNPFGEGKKTMASRSHGSTIFAVRCIGDELSFAVRWAGGDQKFTAGDEFLVKYRADSGPILDAVAHAVDQQMLLLAATQLMVKQLHDAKQVALRFVSAAVAFDEVFDVSGASWALADVVKACPLE